MVASVPFSLIHQKKKKKEPKTPYILASLLCYQVLFNPKKEEENGQI